MDVHAIRRANLHRIIKQAGSRKAVQEAMGFGNVNFIARLLSETNASKKGMGDELARRFEEVYHKPHGWMDGCNLTDRANRIAEAVDTLPAGKVALVEQLVAALASGQALPDATTMTAGTPRAKGGRK